MISSVKAFNAVPHEQGSLNEVLNRLGCYLTTRIYITSTLVGFGGTCVELVGDGDMVLEGKSILEDVKLGVEGATEEMVEDACRAALFHEFVRDLSDGYETILGGGGAAGVALSGGQKQRLAIASARLRNPSVLVLG